MSEATRGKTTESGNEFGTESPFESENWNEAGFEPELDDDCDDDLPAHEPEPASAAAIWKQRALAQTLIARAHAHREAIADAFIKAICAGRVSLFRVLVDLEVDAATAAEESNRPHLPTLGELLFREIDRERTRKAAERRKAAAQEPCDGPRRSSAPQEAPPSPDIDLEASAAPAPQAEAPDRCRGGEAAPAPAASTPEKNAMSKEGASAPALSKRRCCDARVVAKSSGPARPIDRACRDAGLKPRSSIPKAVTNSSHGIRRSPGAPYFARSWRSVGFPAGSPIADRCEAKWGGECEMAIKF